MSEPAVRSRQIGNTGYYATGSRDHGRYVITDDRYLPLALAEWDDDLGRYRVRKPRGRKTLGWAKNLPDVVRVMLGQAV